MESAMITSKKLFLEAVKAANAERERMKLENAIQTAKRLQIKLSDVGIGSDIQNDVMVVIAGEYEVYEGYDDYRSSCYKLRNIETNRSVRIGYSSSKIDDRFIQRIGEAMMELDKSAPKTIEPTFIYTFKGNSLGEILEEVLGYIAHEAHQSL